MSNEVATRLKRIYAESTLKSPYKKMSLARRYWIYQWERLPVIPLVLMGLAVGAAAMRANDIFSWPHLAAATILVSAYLLQIRFADEPKDYEHDNQFYPTRPVQRGVITLTELLRLRNLMIGIFFVTAAILGTWQVFLLACLQQLYSFLTRKEFFVREWLRRHFLTYMFSHYFQLLILSWLTMTVLQVPDSQKPIYFGYAVLLMAVVELARKIQEADNDKAGDTYSAVLGKSKAVGFLVLVVLALAAYTAWILTMINGEMSALWITAAGAGMVLYLSIRYLGQPDKRNTKLLQGGSLLYYFLCAITIIIGA